MANPKTVQAEKSTSTNIKGSEATDAWYAVARAHLKGVVSLLCTPLDQFFNRGKAVRRIVLFVCLAMVVEAGRWLMDFSASMLTSGQSAGEIAALWAGVMTPLSGLLAMVFKFYSDGRAPHE